MQREFVVAYYESENGNKPVKDFVFELNDKQRAKVIRDLNQLEEFGIGYHIPDTKKLSGTPLWELRILGRDNIRVIYVLRIGKIILLLHGFIKKKQKTPVKEINIALKRLDDWNNRH